MIRSLIFTVIALLAVQARVPAQSSQSYFIQFPDVIAQSGSEIGGPVAVAAVFPSKPAWCQRVTIDYDEGGHGPTAIENPSTAPRPPGQWNVGCAVSFRHGVTNIPFDGMGFTYPYTYQAVPAFDGVADCQGVSSKYWNVNGNHHITRTYRKNTTDIWEKWAFDGFSRFDRDGLHWMWITAKPKIGESSDGHWIKNGDVVFKFPVGFTVTYHSQ